MRTRHVLQLSGLMFVMGCAPTFSCGRINLGCRPIDLNISCSPVSFGGGGGSSSPVDEDSFFVPDDDDDSAGSDTWDAYSWAAATFTMTLDVSGATGDASGTYVISYWNDSAATDLHCVQTMAWAGTAFPGESTPSCTLCTGYVAVDEQTVDDVSDPENDADACFIEDIVDDGTLGHRLLLDGNSFTRIAVVDGLQIEDSGYEPAGTLSTLDAGIAALPAGAQFSHLGFIRGDGGALEDITAVTNPIGTNDAWAPLWVIGAVPGQADPDLAALDGSYVGVALYGLR